MAQFNPTKFQSTQEMLEAMGFTIDAEKQVFRHRQHEITFPAHESIGHSPITFYEKMKRREWLPETVACQATSTPVNVYDGMIFVEEKTDIPAARWGDTIPYREPTFQDAGSITPFTYEDGLAELEEPKHVYKYIPRVQESGLFKVGKIVSGSVAPAKIDGSKIIPARMIANSGLILARIKEVENLLVHAKTMLAKVMTAPIALPRIERKTLGAALLEMQTALVLCEELKAKVPPEPQRRIVYPSTFQYVSADAVSPSPHAESSEDEVVYSLVVQQAAQRLTSVFRTGQRGSIASKRRLL